MDSGVDLYIDKLRDEAAAQYQKARDAAFDKRDQAPPGSKEAREAQAEIDKYNDFREAAGRFHDDFYFTSVMWRLGISWSNDVIPLCDQMRCLKGEAFLKFAAMVRAAKLTLPTESELNGRGVKLEREGRYSLAGWHDHLRQKHQELLAYLDEAMAHGSSLYCEYLYG